MPLNQSQHRQVDVNLQASAALGPADASTVYTTGIDTRGGSTGQPINPNQTVDQLGSVARQRMEVGVNVDATTTLVATKNMTFGIQDSDDNVSFAAIAGLTTQVVTGVTGNGSPATLLRWSLPSFARRYVRASNSNPADGGTNTAFNFAIQLLT